MREVTPLMHFASDVHLWDRKPPCRHGEKDWWQAMERPLSQLRDIVQGRPLIYAGDIFHKPNAKPELINWAIKALPRGYSIPGQHDLPYHNYQDMHKSAYQTLVEAGTLTHLEPGVANRLGPHLEIAAFPWGHDVVPNLEREDGVIYVAVIHAYIWTANCGYPGCPESANLSQWESRLGGYDVAVFGDNHIGFLGRAGGCKVINCGCLIRRSTAEAELLPAAYTLNSDLTIDTYLLDVSADVIDGKADEEVPPVVRADFGAFLQDLKALADTPHDYRAALIRHMDAEGVKPAVRRLILTAMGAGDDD